MSYVFKDNLSSPKDNHTTIVYYLTLTTNNQHTTCYYL